MFIGLLCAVIKSLGVPVSLIIYGEFTAQLIDREYGSVGDSKTLFPKFYGGEKEFS